MSHDDRIQYFISSPFGQVTQILVFLFDSANNLFPFFNIKLS